MKLSLISLKGNNLNLEKLSYKLVLKDLFQNIKKAHTYYNLKNNYNIKMENICVWKSYFQWDFKLEDNFKMKHF